MRLRPRFIVCLNTWNWQGKALKFRVPFFTQHRRSTETLKWPTIPIWHRRGILLLFCREKITWINGYSYFRGYGLDDVWFQARRVIPTPLTNVRIRLLQYETTTETDVATVAGQIAALHARYCIVPRGPRVKSHRDWYDQRNQNGRLLTCHAQI